MKNYTQLLHQLAENISLNIPVLFTGGLECILSWNTIVEELITNNARRTAYYTHLYLMQYQLSEAQRKDFESIVPLTAREVTVLSAITAVNAIYELDSVAPFSREHMTQLCEFIAGELLKIELPDVEQQ